MKPDQPKSLSKKMLDAGFKPRDRHLKCDECGAKVTAQFMSLHECGAARAKLTDNDLSELARFRAFLRDVPGKSLAELIEAHGAEYLGFTADEVTKTQCQPDGVAIVAELADAQR